MVMGFNRDNFIMSDFVIYTLHTVLVIELNEESYDAIKTQGLCGYKEMETILITNLWPPERVGKVLHSNLIKELLLSDF